MRKGPVYLSVTSSADLKALDATSQKLRDLGRSSKSAGSSVKNMAKTLGVAFGAQSLISFGKSAVNAASDLNEMQSKIGQVFGSKGQADLIAWSKTAATTFGQSQRQALDAASNFGIFAQSAGMTGQSAVDFSKEFTVLAADLASFNNTSVDEAILALGAGLRGENEPLRRFGVLLDDATLKSRALALGIIQNTKGALTPQQKVLAAHAEILSQTTKAQGDYARTSGGLANQQRSLTAVFEDLTASIGLPVMNALTPIVAALQPVLASLTPVLTMVGQLLASVVTALGRGLKPLIPIIVKMLEALMPAFVMLVDAVGALLPLIVVLMPMLRVLVDLMGKFLPVAIKLMTEAWKGLALVLQKVFGFFASVAEKLHMNMLAGPLRDAANAAEDVHSQLDKISKTDYSKLSAGLVDTSVDYKGAAAALKAGAVDASAAAKAVGSATGKKTAKVKPKTATTARAKTGDQSFTVAGSGGGLSLSVTVNGSVVQERDIARTIRDELVQFARRQGVTPQFGV